MKVLDLKAFVPAKDFEVSRRFYADLGFAPCVACLPRYLANAAWGDHDVSFALFRTWQLSDLLRPEILAASGIATACVLAIAIGARFAALPVLWRDARGDGARRARG